MKCGSFIVTFFRPTTRMSSKLDDAIDQEKGIAMREDLLDRLNVENGHLVPQL